MRARVCVLHIGTCEYKYNSARARVSARALARRNDGGEKEEEWTTAAAAARGSAAARSSDGEHQQQRPRPKQGTTRASRFVRQRCDSATRTRGTQEETEAEEEVQQRTGYQCTTSRSK